MHICCIVFVTMSSLDISRFVKQWNREYIVMRFGVYIYQMNDAVASIKPKINSLFGYDQAMKDFKDYFKDSKKSPDNKYTNI